ncbi:MAG: Ig-like domain-containing protein [Acetobacterium sp.]
MKKRLQRGLSLFVAVMMLLCMMPIGAMANDATIENEENTSLENKNVISNENPQLPTDTRLQTEILTTEQDAQTVELNNADVQIEVTLSKTDNLQADIGKKMIEMGISDYKNVTSLKINAGIGVPIGGRDIDFIRDNLVNIKKIDFSGLKEILYPSASLDGCETLEEVILQDGAILMNTSFSYCTSLKSIDLSKANPHFSYKMFYGCTSLKQVLLPYGAEIGWYMFEDCTSLKSMDLTYAYKWIGYEAFRNCSSLEKVILPSNTILGGNTFSFCTALDDVNWNAIASFDGDYGFDLDSFRGCAFDFTKGYPSANWTNNNMLYSNAQIPKLYFSLEKDAYQVNVDDSFTVPTPIFKTENGTNYRDLETYKNIYSPWLDQDTSYLQKMTYETTIKYKGQVVDRVDTSNSGTYEITYDLLGTTYADCHSLTCNVMVIPGYSISDFETDKTSGQVVNSTINLTASATAGENPYQYKFYYRLNDSDIVLKDFSSINTATFRPTTSGTYTLFVEAKDNSGKTCIKSINDYVIYEKINKPTANYESGTILKDSQLILTTFTEGATIYYTTDGTDPSTEGSRKIYSNPITVTENMNFRTIASKDGMDNSEELILNFTVTIPLTGIALNKTSTDVIKGKIEQLTMAYTPEDTTDNKTINWTSNDASVAAVDTAGKVTAVKAGTATITATTTDGSKTATCVVTVNDPIVNVTNVTVSEATKALTTGNYFSLTATVSPANATNKTITWSSDKADIATVDANGKVIAVKAGTATITAETTDGSKKANCVVIVTDPIVNVNVTGVTVNESTKALTTDANFNLIATISPANATNKTITWSSDKADIATVDANGKITAVKAGTATITVKTADGNKTAICGLIVTDPIVNITEITLSETAKALTTGNYFNLTATVSPANATNKAITWASSNAGVAVVDTAGKVTAVKAGNATITVTTTDGNKTANCLVTVKESINKIGATYQTHVQNVGWQSTVSNGAMSGTSGLGLRLEGIQINVDNLGYDIGIDYQTQIENIGWQGFKSNGEMSGTSGKGLRLEAIQMKLTGADADKCDIYYQVHAQNYGWLGWAKNGESAGTEGFGYRLEAIKIVVVPKGDPAPGTTEQPFAKNVYCSYQTQVQNIGWQGFKSNGDMSGTSGMGLRLEGIKINTSDPTNLGVEYQTQVENIGWQGFKNNGEMSGTSGKSLRLEAIQMRLTGADADKYDVYYQVHAQNYGWLGWAKNGESAGTEGFGYRLEAIKIVVVPKGTEAPGSTVRPFQKRMSVAIQRTNEQNYNDSSDNRLVYESFYERPIFDKNTAAGIKMNETYDALESSWKAENTTNLNTFKQRYENDAQFREIMKKDDRNMNCVWSEVKYNSNNLISVVQHKWIYPYSTHGLDTYTSQTFNAKTGEEITFGDLLCIDESEISEKMTQEFAKLKVSSSRYSNVDLTKVAKYMSADSHYYLTAEGIYVYFNPYVVTSYSAGSVAITIPYSRTDLLKPIDTLIQ